MSDLDFHQTRAGRTYYEHTLPELLRQLQRLKQNIERLVNAAEPPTPQGPQGGPHDRNEDEEEDQPPHP